MPLRLLVLYAGVRSLTPILSQALTITGDTRYAMQRSLVAAIILPIAFAIGSQWGITGIASAWILVPRACRAVSRCFDAWRLTSASVRGSTCRRCAQLSCRLRSWRAGLDCRSRNFPAARHRCRVGDQARRWGRVRTQRPSGFSVQGERVRRTRLRQMRERSVSTA